MKLNPLFFSLTKSELNFFSFYWFRNWHRGKIIMKLRKRGRRNETTANSGERESQKVSRRRMSRIRNRHGKEKDEVSVLTFVCLL